MKNTIQFRLETVFETVPLEKNQHLNDMTTYMFDNLRPGMLLMLGHQYLSFEIDCERHGRRPESRKTMAAANTVYPLSDEYQSVHAVSGYSLYFCLDTWTCPSDVWYFLDHRTDDAARPASGHASELYLVRLPAPGI